MMITIVEEQQKLCTMKHMSAFQKFLMPQTYIKPSSHELDKEACMDLTVRLFSHYQSLCARLTTHL